MSVKAWAGAFGVSALVAAGDAAYYMAQDEEEKEIIFDPNVHTKEKFMQILEQFEIEYASLYLHWYSMFKAKEKEVGKGKVPEEIIETAKQKLQELTANIDEEVISEHGLNKTFFDKWAAKYSNDPDVLKISKKLEDNFDKLLKIEKPDFNFDYPKELTKEKYIKFINTAYQKFRYDTYHEIQNYLKQTGKKQIDESEFNEIIKKCSLQEIKIKVYRKMGLPEVPGEKPTRTALKAYLVLMQEDEAWHKEILHIQKEHKNILFSLPSGQKMQGMHEDPLEVLEREIKYGTSNSNGKNEPKVVELTGNKPSTDKEESKKNPGSFSFMGSSDYQQELIQNFLNRNKEKKENVKTSEVEDSAEVIDNPKPEGNSETHEDKSATEKQDEHKEDIKQENDNKDNQHDEIKENKQDEEDNTKQYEMEGEQDHESQPLLKGNKTPENQNEEKDEVVAEAEPN